MPRINPSWWSENQRRGYSIGYFCLSLLVALSNHFLATPSRAIGLSNCRLADEWANLFGFKCGNAFLAMEASFARSVRRYNL